MNIPSELSGHWTDDQLIAHLYDVGPEDRSHVEHCLECSARLAAMRARQELVAAGEEPVSSGFLAAQRRRIYARMSERPALWSRLHVTRWASAAAVGLILGGGLFYVEERAQQSNRDKMLSDAQLVQDVSNMAENSDVQPIAPLQGLFEE